MVRKRDFMRGCGCPEVSREKQTPNLLHHEWLGVAHLFERALIPGFIVRRLIEMREQPQVILEGGIPIHRRRRRKTGAGGKVEIEGVEVHRKASLRSIPKLSAEA